MDTHEEELLIIGAWLLGIGTLTAAVGQTQQTVSENDQGKGLIIKGNVLEAFGNSLQAVGRTKFLHPGRELSRLYYIVGCWLEAAGNTTNAVGIDIELNVSEDEGIKVDTLGSGVQALGAAFEVVGALLAEFSVASSLEIAGNSFISLGAILESIGNIFVLNNQSAIGEQILLIGSWIQFIGALLIIEAFTLGSEKEPENSSEDQNGLHYYYFHNKGGRCRVT